VISGEAYALCTHRTPTSTARVLGVTAANLFSTSPIGDSTLRP